MAYTTPITWTSTTDISVANLNLIQDNIRHLANPPKAKIASAGATTSLSSGTSKKIEFDGSTTEYYDNDGLWTSGDDFLEVQTEGVYLVQASVGFWLNATGERAVYIFDDTTRITSSGPVPGTATSFTPALQVIQCVTMGFFSVGDEISVHAEQDSGGALNAGGNFDSWLSCLWIGTST